MSAPPPPLRPWGLASVPVPTGTAAGVMDRRAIEEQGIPSPVLMENAGRSAALILQHLFPRGRVLVVVGGGNNGGDGLVVARTLAAWGRPVALVNGGGRPLRRDLLHGWDPPVYPAEAGEEGKTALLPGAPDVVVDALLGTGLHNTPRHPQAGWITRINSSAAPVVALDLPSGVDSDTGALAGQEAVRAHLTVAFGWPKLGTLLHPGRSHVGRLVVVEIGFPPPRGGEIRASLITPAWAAARRPRREPDTHKYAVGSLLLVAGGRGMAGAAVLAGRAALRAGVGLLRVASTTENRTILQGALPEALFIDRADSDALEAGAERSSALAVGPGLGLEAPGLGPLGRLLESSRLPLVMDADALTLAGSALPGLAALGASRPLLLTPHPGEMARILDEPRDAVQADRPGAARRGAERFFASLLLKGHPTLVASPGGDLLVDTGGSSDLATAGMGDVLTGVAGALLAAGVDVLSAAGVALQATGRAAVLADRGAGLSPLDVAGHLPAAMREPGPGTTDLPFPFITFDQDPSR